MTPAELEIRNVMHGNPSDEWILQNIGAIQEISTKKKKEVSALSLMKPCSLYDPKHTRKKAKLDDCESRNKEKCEK